jgi:hypothetical protein
VDPGQVVPTDALGGRAGTLPGISSSDGAAPQPNHDLSVAC